MTWRNRNSNPDIFVEVEIFQSVDDRIFNSVSGSNIEEGGKFLGTIQQRQGNKLLITVKSYIDSGVDVDNSSGHLMPDGDYQEKMFRVVEKFDPTLDYIGSWHSHHCNGFPELSSGDINGYQETVNSPSYDVNYLFVILVTDITKSSTKKRYYLFVRGQNNYYELDQSNIKFIRQSSVVEPVLSEAERIAFKLRKQRSSNRYTQSRNQHSSSLNIDPLQEIRSEDNQWILNYFPGTKATRNKINGAISWQWSILLENSELICSYTHPISTSQVPATLEVEHDRKLILSQKIELTDNRFDKINTYLEKAKTLVRSERVVN